MSCPQLEQDDRGFLYVRGVKVARLVKHNGYECLQFHDKDRRRCSERGSDKVHVDVVDFAHFLLTRTQTA